MTESVRLRVRLPAPVGAVRRALTDPAALRQWLAEHAEARHGRYAFWGRYTPEGGEPSQRLLHRDDPLRFSWPLNGHETTVEVRTEEENAGATLLTLSQEELAGEYDGYPAALALTVFWSLALGNLVDHLLGRPITPRCDHTSGDPRATFVIGAPRARVFGSLTDPAEFARWFGLPVEMEPYAGGRWRIGGGGPVGTVRALEPGRLLSLQEDSGVATWELTDDDDGATRVTFGLSDYPRLSRPSWSGWLSAMSSLRRYHELDDWQPIWLGD
ncbi:MAG: SRPBCC family protein [Actinoallomurus sp.]